jgi:hypothetical protein
VCSHPCCADHAAWTLKGVVAMALVRSRRLKGLTESPTLHVHRERAEQVGAGTALIEQ